MLVEHDWQIFINGQQLAERILLDKFPSPAIGQHISQSPVGVVRPYNTTCAVDPRLVTVTQDLPADIAENNQTPLDETNRKTRKPCYRKETTRCSMFFLRPMTLL